MKVIEVSRGYDVYFKTEESAQLFSNYWGTVEPSAFEAEQTKILEEAEFLEKVDQAYNYTLNWYPPKSVVDSYLELFPEEKE